MLHVRRRLGGTLFAMILTLATATAPAGQTGGGFVLPDSGPTSQSTGKPGLAIGGLEDPVGDAMSTGLGVLAWLRLPQNPTAPEVSEAEQIAQLSRSIESSKRELNRLQAERNGPRSEYAQAEAEFRQLDEKLVRLRKAIREAGPEEAEKLKEQVAEHEKTWKLSKDRFDLAIDERKALQEQIDALQQKLQRDQEALDRLTGAKPAAETAPKTTAPSSDTPAPAPTATTPAATPPAATNPPAEPATTVTLPGLPSIPAAETPTPEPGARPADSEKAKPSKELVEAQEDVQRKAEIAEQARRNAESVGDRLEALDRSIVLEKKLLEMDRKESENAEQTRAALSEEFTNRSVGGAPIEERRDLAIKVRAAQERLAEARGEVRKHTDRIDELQSERASLLAEQLDAAKAAAEAGQQVKLAEKKVAALENPFAPRNLLQWGIDHGPKLLGILGAMVLLLLVSRLFTRRVVKIMAQGGIRGSREEREARANTLVGVFHNAVSVSVSIGGILMILQEVGIPIGPLLGGAAIFGLAVAFGAQNLVRDYFYGFVILLENQYKLNDVVKIGDVSGQVERITLRMTVLRDQEGCVHFIPNGNITTVTNMTHGWSRAVFDIGIAYKEDVDRVIGVIEELGRELRADPAFRLMILEDLEMLGVEALGESAVVLRFLIKTRTLKQWTIKREMLRRVKNKFDDLGIEIPFPQTTLHHRLEGEPAAPAEEVSRRITLHGRHGPTG